jgi:chemotaxis protein methyltransferase CheR
MGNKSKIDITEDILDSFVSILTKYTGIIPRASHRDGIKNFIETSIAQKKCTIEEYKQLLSENEDIISEFINQSTVNETYFFREEKQFLLLKEKLFPMWKLKNPGKEMRIWSAACSYGEEAYSLAVMALTCGITPSVTATDINSDVLEHCSNGIFLGTSLRPIDGSLFHDLILSYKREDGRLAFPEKIKSHIRTSQLNLVELDSVLNTSLLPRNQNLIFIRNVFIYFSLDLRKMILKNIAEKFLAEDGYLFVSMSEIAQLDSTVVPDCLEKVSDGSIFYFHKKTSGGKINGSNLK